MANCSCSQAWKPMACRCATSAGDGPNPACSRNRCAAEEDTCALPKGRSVTVALKVWVLDVPVTVTVFKIGIAEGAVYNPVALMEPAVADQAIICPTGAPN